jgi:hypothetical protein
MFLFRNNFKLLRNYNKTSTDFPCAFTQFSQGTIFFVCCTGVWTQGLYLQPLHLLLFFFFIIVVLGWGHIVALTQVLTMYQMYHTWVHPLHCSPLPSPTPILGVVSAGIIFAFTYLCTHCPFFWRFFLR